MTVLQVHYTPKSRRNASVNVKLKIIYNLFRYWGKFFGLKRNYYVLECEWQNEELEYKLRVSGF